MNDIERELRDRFTRIEGRLTGTGFAPPSAPAEVLRRAKGRQVRTVLLGSLAAAAVVVASFAGATALIRSSEHRVPTEPPDVLPTGPLVPVAAQPTSFEGIVADTDGNLWSTTPGLTRLDPRTGSSRTFTVADDPAFGGVTDIAPAREGGLWIVSEGADGLAVLRFDGTGFVEATTPAPGYVSDVAEAPDGTLWASGNSVYVWDGTAWVERPPGPGGAARAIAVDTAGSVWVERITYSGPEPLGVARFDGSAWITFPVDEVLPAEELSVPADAPDLGRVWTIVPGPIGDVWLGGRGGIAHFADGAWTAYPSDVLGLRNVMSIAVADGVVWAGGEAMGPPAVARFDGSTWTSVSDGLEGDGGTEYTRLVATSDAVWATTNIGLFRLEGSGWQRVNAADRPSDVMPPVVAAGADELWMGDWTARGGVWHFESDRWTHLDEADGLPGGELHAVAVAQDGTTWVAAKHGLGAFDGSVWRRVSPGQHWAAAVAPDGVVWTASGELGAGVEGGWTVAPVGGTALPPLTLVETPVNDLAVDPGGAVWAGSAGVWGLGGGLARFDGGSWQLMEPVPEAGAEILVTDIEVTAEGDVWVALQVPAEAEGTFTGLVLARYHNGTWTTFGEADGITLDGGFWADPLTVAADGTLLVAAHEGLFAFHDGTWSILQEGIFPLGATAIVSVAPDGTTWIAAGGGLFRLAPA